MQCPSCRTVLGRGSDSCPLCDNQKLKTSIEAKMNPTSPEGFFQRLPREFSSDEEIPRSGNELNRKRSTLIEFPGTNRSSKPQWRQELSERVREIKERKARESNDVQGHTVKLADRPSSGATLEVVTPSETADVNPIVAAALRRIERARQPDVPAPRRGVSGRGSATAVARAAEESFEERSAPLVKAEPILISVPAPDTETSLPPREPEPVKEHKLVVVAPPLVVVPPVLENVAVSEVAPLTPATREPRKVIDGVVDDTYLSRLEAQLLPEVARHEPLERYAPVGHRLCAGVLDLFIVGFLTSPFAAVIELSGANWADPRVQVSMASIAVLVLFLYHTASLGLSGRTYGMSFFSLRAVDSRTGVHPTTLQSIGRAVAYIVVIATAFLGLLTALFDAERRTLHDMLSRTVVVID
jgi:uncharacterized RDD family membrane protein YckC